MISDVHAEVNKTHNHLVVAQICFPAALTQIVHYTVDSSGSLGQAHANLLPASDSLDRGMSGDREAKYVNRGRWTLCISKLPKPKWNLLRQGCRTR